MTGGLGLNSLCSDGILHLGCWNKVEVWRSRNKVEVWRSRNKVEVWRSRNKVEVWRSQNKVEVWRSQNKVEVWRSYRLCMIVLTLYKQTVLTQARVHNFVLSHLNKHCQNKISMAEH